MTEDISARHYLDLARRAVRTGDMVFTDFLEPGAAENEVRHAANEAGCAVAFSGGYPDAERRIACFTTWQETAEEDYPIDCLAITWHEKYGSCGHRDVLGALMGLGYTRDRFGDIVPGGPGAGDAGEGIGLFYLMCEASSAQYVARSLTKCGACTVRVARARPPIDIKASEGKTLRVTLASPRLDAVLGAGMSLSRSEAREMIEKGLVRKNHIDCLRPDAVVKSGDILSVRGKGRLRVGECGGETRKGRLSWLLIRY